LSAGQKEEDEKVEEEESERGINESKRARAQKKRTKERAWGKNARHRLREGKLTWFFFSA
jgi:hypothetical protein